MRGCLFTLVLGAVVVFLALTLGLPALAAGLIGGALTAAGLQSDSTTVVVTSDPTTELLGLHADRVHVTASKATFRGLEMDRLDLTLTDVAIVDRTAGGLDGTMTGVTVPLAGGQDVRLQEIALAGGGDTLTATTVVPNADLEALIGDAVEGAAGVRPTAITPSAPDVVAIKTAGVVTHARLVVTEAGDLALLATDGPAKGTQQTLLRGGKDLPITFTSVKVTSAGDVRLSGRLAIGIF